MSDNELLQAIYNNTEELKGKLSNVESDISELKQRVSSLESDMSELEQDVSELKLDVSELKLDVSELKQDVSELKQRVSSLESDMTNIKLILENEICIDIKRVAEGHLDLSRNLQKAMKPSNELEMLSVKVSLMEIDLREIKQKIS